VTIEKASGTAGADSFLTVSGNKSGKIRLLNAAVEASKKDIVLENGASGSAVVRQ
jgi:hypothetical protein